MILMKVEWLSSVCSLGLHNAFTDLCLFKGSLYCCFRQARNHVSDDGIIWIFTLNLTGKVLAKMSLRMANYDLRDPKLSVSPEGNLMLIAYARGVNQGTAKLASKNMNWVSSDGLSWSSPKSFAKDNWWLWRIRWHNDQAYGFAYNRAANSIDFYQGHPRRAFHKQVSGALSLQKHQLAYPNESDLFFNDKQCFAIVRRDADSFSAQLGISQFPFKTWKWLDLKFYLGGPVMAFLNDNVAIVAGRVQRKNSLVTAVFTLNLSSGKVLQKLYLPSAGDNSYPGMVIIDSTLYLSYYSSHKDNKSQIYLVKILLSNQVDV
jgi:hypothetical protein